MAGREGAAWITPASLGVVACWLAAARWLEAAPEARGELHVRVVLALGYGHLLASVAGRGARSERRRSPAHTTCPWLLPAALLVAAYAAYAALCRLWPLLPLGLLWRHTHRLGPCIAMHTGFNLAAIWQQTAARPG